MPIIAIGADYDFRLESDINNIIYPNETDAGSIILLPFVTDKETIYIVYNNTYNMTRYDSIKLHDNSSSISIQDDTLTPGESKEMLLVGEYSFHELANPNNTGIIIVNDIDKKTYQFSIDDSPSMFDVELDNYTITTDEEEIIKINISIDMNVQPGSYDIVISVDDDSVEKTIEHTINVGYYINCSIKNNTFMTQLNLGQSGEFGDIIINNNGNAAITLSIDVSGNITDFISSQLGFIAFNGFDNRLPIAYNVPTTYKVGNYSGQIKLFYDNYVDNKTIIEIFNVTVLVQDTLFPSITSLNFSDAIISEPINMTFTAIDNSQINYGQVEWKYEDFTNGVIDIINSTLNGIYYNEKIFAQVGKYSYELCVFDDSFNSNCSNGIIRVNKKDCVEYKESLDYKRQKFDRYSDTELLELIGNLNLTIGLKMLNYPENASYSIRITDPDDIERYLDSIGATVNVTKIGIYKIGFRGTNISEYRGIISLSTKEKHIDFKEISFTGEVINYTIPTVIQRDDWYGNKLECIPVDSGIVETSYIDCKIRFPIWQDILQLAIPTTLEDKEIERLKYEQDRKDIEGELQDKKTHLKCIWLLFIILLLFTLYMIFVYPIWRIKIR